MTNAPTLDPQAAIARLEAWLRENRNDVICHPAGMPIFMWSNVTNRVVAEGRGLLTLAHALPRLEVAG